VKHMRYLRIGQGSPYRQIVGVGGVGAGIFFRLDGNETLGRNESRLGTLLDVRDYCKLHIVIHYIAKLLGAGTEQSAFRVIPVAKVGDDATGEMLISEMRAAGMETTYIRRMAGYPTLFSVCFQYPDGCGGNITSSNSAAALLSNADIDASAHLLQAGSIALALPEVPVEVRQHFLEVATRSGAFRAASFAAAEVKQAQDKGLFELLDLVALNEEEGEEFAGCAFSPESPESFVRGCQDLLRSSFRNLRVVISAGKLGAYGITAQASAFCPAPKVKVLSTAGAGDSLLGGVLSALVAGIPFISETSGSGQVARVIDSALQLGVLLGSYKCLSPHTIHPEASLDTLIAFAAEEGIAFSEEMQKRFAGAGLPEIIDQVLP
jgi:sugar/nucleoside kinase (ribokinase family)